MNLEISDVIEYDNQDYVVLDVINHKEMTYALINKLDKEEPTEEYKVINVIEDTVADETNKDILEEIMPIFSKDIQKLVDYYNENLKGDN